MLFYLVTLSAIVAACAQFLRRDNDQPLPWDSAGQLLIVSAGVGFLVGIILFFLRPNYRWLAPMFGILMGLIAAPLLLIPIGNHWQIMVISFVGCWVLVIFTLLSARFSKDSYRS